MNQLCKISGKEFEITNDDLDFYNKMDVPPPLLSPSERLRRRFAFRHGGNLHRIKCDGTGKMIISMYPQERDFKVYEQEYWWSDAWNALDYGKEYDFSKPFFQQFKELFNAVPHLALLNTNSENSYYTNHALNQKNCYLLFGAVDNQDCQYGYFVINCRDVFDGHSVFDCELCYDGLSSYKCYNCISFFNCRNCTDCIVIEDCNNCTNCIACFGLRNKGYHILNKEVTKVEWERFKTSLDISTFGNLERLKKQFSDLKSKLVYPAYHLINCENSTGDTLINCKNCRYSFDADYSEDSKFLAFTGHSKNSYDCSYGRGGGTQFCYECVSTIATDSKFSAVVWHSNELDYSMECHSCNNLFGSIGLRKTQYAILNKQYNKESYFALRKKIIEQMKITGEWGEFFPAELTPFAYNDSIASLYLPLDPKSAIKLGYRWREEEIEDKEFPTIESVPENIKDVTDDILQKTLICKNSKKPYRINQKELEFYRKMNLPIPRISSQERHHERINKLHGFMLYKRKCEFSSEEIYSPYRTEKVAKQELFID